MSYKNLYSDHFSNFPKKIDRTIYEEIRFNTVKNLKKLEVFKMCFIVGILTLLGYQI